MRRLHLKRKTVIQMIVLTVVTAIVGTIMALGFVGLPGLLFGIGQYKVTMLLPEAGGLYPRANVTWRGTEVGRVQSVDLTGRGVEAELSLNSGYKIPADLDAQVPGIRNRIVDAGPVIRPHINVFVAGQRASLETPVEPGAVVHVIPAVSGGRR